MNKKTLYILILVFIINPFLGVTSLMAIKLLTNKKENYSDLFIFIFITVYASLLQSTRVWNVNLPSDWNGSYLELFQSAKSTSGFAYILMQKEPVWNLLNYIGYYLSNGSAYLFLNTIAVSTIFLTSLSIFIYWKRTQTNPSTLIASMVLIVFFTEYYGQLNNLLRQYFSLSIVVYAYVRKITLNKSSWWLLIIASLVHSLSFVFLFLYFIKPLYKKISFSGMLKIAGIALVMTLIFNHIEFIRNIFSEIQFLTYGFDRLISAGNPTDKNFLDSTTVYFNALFLIFATAVLINNKYIIANIVFFKNILIALMVLTMFLFTLAPEIMSRLYVSRFYIFPFVIPYFLTNKKFLNNLCNYLIIIFFSIRFFFTFNSIRGGGFFPPVGEIISYSIVNFFL